MRKQEHNQKGFSPVILILVIVIVVLVGAVGWLVYNNQKQTTNKSVSQETSTPTKKATEPTTTPSLVASAKLTNDQIYQEVATQFNLVRSKVAYFRIFGQDKVQYNSGLGTTFIYKQGNKWLVAQKDGQGAVNCDSLSNIPDNYRPPCMDSTGQFKYTDSNNASLNYPMSQAASYIGE